jgi:hypothetical protein
MVVEELTHEEARARELVANLEHSFRRVYQQYLNGIYGHGLQRDYFGTLGYYKSPDEDIYYLWYRQGGIAHAIVSLPADDTWKRPPAITEGGEVNTEFVRAWGELSERLRAWSVLSRADRISGIGSYGGVIVGTALAEGEGSADPLEQAGADDILYLRPFWEGDVVNIEWNKDRRSARYGLPERYKIRLAAGDSDSELGVYHWTRILHIAENRDTSEVYGTPRLESCLMYLVDLLKYHGGAAEAAWLNMRKGLVIKPGEGYKLTTDNDDFLDAIQEYADGMMRLIKVGYGNMDVMDVGQENVPDVSGNIDSELDLISSATRIPKRILTGSAAGELASAREDTRQWAGHIAQRQETHAEPNILRPFIDRLIGIGALPEPPDSYDVGTYDEDSDAWRWPSIIDMSDEEQAEIIRARAEARQTLSRDPLVSYPSTREEDRELLGLPPEPERDEIALQVRVNQVDPFVPTTGNASADEVLAGYSDNLADLAERAAEGEITEEEFEDELTALIGSVSLALYLRASGKPIQELNNDDWLEIQKYQQVNLDSVPRLKEDIYAGNFEDDEGDVKPGALAARVTLWLMSAMALANQATVRSDLEANYVWRLGGTIEHCADCLRLDGQVHTGREWLRSGWLPQTQVLECGGWNCDCRLERTRMDKRGNF